MENSRTETARDHDDSAIIDQAEPAPEAAGRSGGALAQEVGTKDELSQVTDPDGITRAEKADDQATGNAAPGDRARGA